MLKYSVQKSVTKPPEMILIYKTKAESNMDRRFHGKILVERMLPLVVMER